MPEWVGFAAILHLECPVSFVAGCTGRRMKNLSTPSHSEHAPSMPLTLSTAQAAARTATDMGRMLQRWLAVSSRVTAACDAACTLPPGCTLAARGAACMPCMPCPCAEQCLCCSIRAQQCKLSASCRLQATPLEWPRTSHCTRSGCLHVMVQQWSRPFSR